MKFRIWLSLKTTLLFFLENHIGRWKDKDHKIPANQKEDGEDLKSANIYERSELINFKNSVRVSIFSKAPLNPEVVVTEFCFCTPRIIIHM